MEISEVKVRNEFFVSTLFVETSITSYLSKQLNIVDSVASEFLGNKPTSVRFEQKIDAVLDADVLSIIDKSKLSVFKEIYKEFLSNPDAESPPRKRATDRLHTRHRGSVYRRRKR